MPRRSTVSNRRNRMLGVALALATCLMAGACGAGDEEGLTGASTCDEFMHSPVAEQDELVNALAAEYQKPDWSTPLGRPGVNYFCASNPDVTLDEFFAGAG